MRGARERRDRCWGASYAATHGDVTPAPIAGITDATAVAAGGAMTCALLRNGRVTCWGMNDHRQLGFATLARSASPLEVCALDRVTKLAASYATTCALHDDGAVACWGAGRDWQGYTAVPTAQPGWRGIVDLVGSEAGICALDRAGDVQCRTAWALPLAGPGAPAAQIALGRFGLCGVLRADGSVVCSGKPIADIGKATKVAVGDNFACALVGDKVTCWGQGTIIEPPMSCHGCVCDRPLVDRSPRRSPLAHVVDIAAESGRICARTADGRVRCAPADSLLDARTPIATDHPWAVEPTAHGRDHACTLRVSGLVACSGDNQLGQLGTGATGSVTAPAH